MVDAPFILALKMCFSFSSSLYIGSPTTWMTLPVASWANTSTAHWYDPRTCIHAHAFHSLSPVSHVQELVHLLILGYAASNTHDGDKVLGDDSDHVVLKGVKERATVGLLSLFEHFQSIQVWVTTCVTICASSMSTF